MYDRPYNKLDIGQLPQIAVVDSFYHGLVCESPWVPGPEVIAKVLITSNVCTTKIAWAHKLLTSLYLAKTDISTMEKYPKVYV